jgi:hypothetical protein
VSIYALKACKGIQKAPPQLCFHGVSNGEVQVITVIIWTNKLSQAALGPDHGSLAGPDLASSDNKNIQKTLAPSSKMPNFSSRRPSLVISLL